MASFAHFYGSQVCGCGGGGPQKKKKKKALFFVFFAHASLLTICYFNACQIFFVASFLLL